MKATSRLRSISKTSAANASTSPGCAAERWCFTSIPGRILRAAPWKPASSATVAAQFAGRNAVIVGVSPDKPAAQLKFKTGKSLPFTLLADVDRGAAEAYGVWKEKNMYGKKVMGIERTTFVIGEDGRIERIFRKVKAAGHAGQVLEAVR